MRGCSAQRLRMRLVLYYVPPPCARPLTLDTSFLKNTVSRMFSVLPSTPVKPESPLAASRMQGTLWKWTNYMSGWQQRWFVLEGGTLAYYLASVEVNQGCRGSFKVTSCDIHVHPTDHLRFDIVMPGARQVLYLKASSMVERQQWVVALGTAKQEEEGTIGKLLGPSLDQQVAMKSKMAELQVNCQLLYSQVSNMKTAAVSSSPEVEDMQKMATLIRHTCDNFLKILSECMLLSTASGGAAGKAVAVGMVPATPTDHSSPTLFSPMKALGRVPHSRPHQLSASDTAPHSLPVILPFPMSLPPPRTGKTGKRETSPNSANEVTHSLPVHLAGKLPTSATPLESTDGEERQQKVENPRNDRTVDTDKSPISSSRSHSRANSEAFVTPQSTPTSSPPPSPSHTPHMSHSHTPQSLPQEGVGPVLSSEEPTDTLAMPSSLQRVGDRFPQSEVESGFDSFFSRAPHKFEDLLLDSDEGIPTVNFLDSCRAVVPFFDTLSSTAFAPVKADINGNIEKLSKKYQSSPERFSTLQSMVVYEVETNTHEAKNSATDALLWLKRAMEFIQEFMSDVAGGEHSLDIAAGKAYTKSLRRYHNWIVRSIFSMAVRAVPYHKDFLVLLGSDGTAEGNTAVTVHMANFARALGVIIDIINQFYQSHGLDPPPLL